MSVLQNGATMVESWRGNGTVNGINSTRNPTTLSKIDDFCFALGGSRPIHSILIANNGMAAVKFIRSIRTWAYEAFGTEKAILLVAMATPEDMRINAEHIRIADQFVEVPGGTNNNNYANVQLIVEMAEITHVDAVWPGWGHASENPELPDALTVKIPPQSCLDNIPENIYREACVYTTEEAVASCQVIGYPAMIKASWGGGGKGIRKVHNDDEVKALFKQVQGEVPGSPIFIMKVASQSRHLEVQLICDQHGNVAALHSRDCSVQRRHQKIIEEGPITVAPMETVKKLEQAARRLAKCVNYVGAATVEYLYSMDTGEYYFLELNPRLQVEHPVTEWIAEVNLPAAQVAVGMGIPLWQIPEIRRFYGMDHNGGYDAWRRTSVVATPFDFDKAESVRPKGHCVAVRVTSEDPDDGFKPTGGKVQELSFKSKPNAWAYFSVKSGGGIHEFSDSQFGHVFAFGESRALAIANMVLGLKEIHIRGEIRTNVDYTIDLLHAAEYRDNKIHTGWLDSRIAMRVRAERPPWYLSVVGGALYKASTSSMTMVSDYVGYLEKGQIPPKHISLVNSQVSLNIEGSKYTVDIARGGPRSYKLRMNQSEIEAEIHSLRDGGLLMQLDGSSHVIYAEEEAAGTRILIDGRTCLLQNDHDPSKLVSETPCKLLRFLVPDGSHVEADSPYAEVEVMKMCMPLLLPASGIIHFKISEGQPMQAGDLIARLDLDDPTAVRKAEPFHGSFPLLGPPTAVSGRVHQRLAASLNAARMILAGYEHDINEVVQDLLNCLDSPELPFLQWQECMSVLATRLPKNLRDELDMKYKEYEGFSSSHKILISQPNYCAVFSRESCPCDCPFAFEEYLSVEELFSDNIQADVIERLRLQYKKDLLKIVDIVLSRQQNKLILRLMEALVYPNPAAYREKLIRFSALNHTSYSELALKASQLLEQTKLSELRSNIARSLSELEMFTEEGEHLDTPRRKSAINERMEDLVSTPLAVEDALVGLFDHSDHTLLRRVVETYIRRLYQPYLVKESVRMQWHRSGLIASWEFSEEHVERRNASEDETSTSLMVEKHTERKWGAMVIVKSLQSLPMAISTMMPKGSAEAVSNGNMLHIALVGINNPMSSLQDSGDEDQAQERINKLAKILKEQQVGSALRSAGVKVISCIIQRDEGRTPTRHSFHWSLENLHYEEEPLMRHLEPPLSIFLELEKLKGYEKTQYTPSRDRQWHLYTVVDKPQPVQRMFLRTLVRQPNVNEGFWTYQGLSVGSILRSMMAALEELELHGHNATVRPDHAHMYLYILRGQEIDDLVPYPRSIDLVEGQEEAMVEMTLQELAHEIHENVGVRMHRLGVCEWEVKLRMPSVGLASGAWRLVVTNVTGHTCTVHVNCLATVVGVPILPIPGINKPEEEACVKVKELMFENKEGSWGCPLVSAERPPAQNDIGMVAWSMEMSTPEYPSGRTILIVANDVTFKAGSFGPREDAFFLAVSNLACEKKIPLIYLAANSGARIGVAEEVKACFEVGWSDESSPERGFQYIYLTPEDYAEVGLRNLTGSGAIAGAYSRAYKETFTLTYVTGRTVGIGAYLARLGMRCIQRLDQPIILTGFSALNKLLGREVYSSHMQLGGPKIMGTNGVVHLTVSDDLEGVSAILKWLSYVPSCVGGPLPILTPSDPPQRLVEYFPENSCDPRAAICGLNDKLLSQVGKTWGIPVGIVAVETQTMMQVIPADPGQLDSHERVVPQAGQVWFPDSASKTSQALLDFNREELPLFIMANWRGFSGGQRDLLKVFFKRVPLLLRIFRTYKQPVFVYIPMMGELRGGAWVVVDSKINPDHIEMYAEKKRLRGMTRELLECMGRLDQKLISLKAKLKEAKSSGIEKQILPVYTQIATRFAELHDTSFRMAAKGVIKEVFRTVINAAGDRLCHKSALELIKKWFLDSKPAEVREDSWLDDKAFFQWKDDGKNYEEQLQELRAEKVMLQLSNLGESASDLQVLPHALTMLLSKVESSNRVKLIEELRKVLKHREIF
ncbi:hypothetical protein MKW92_020924 [Papaver armeniacum]|nr:hypothetical protein MKW92_020924 [Papaver armeniacum]